MLILRGCLCSGNVALGAMFFIVKRQPTSQAGRRGFESRLPLHEINNLEAPRIWPAPKCSIYIIRSAVSSALTAARRCPNEARV
jgi:hypothetical protein